MFRKLSLIAIGLLTTVVVVGCQKHSTSGLSKEKVPVGIEPLGSDLAIDYRPTEIREVDYSSAEPVTQFVPAPTPSVAPRYSSPVASTGSTSGGRSRVVRRGDTFWSIARQSYGNGKLWKQIAAANPGVDHRRLRVGQQLIVP